jgi:hypothetical protein
MSIIGGDVDEEQLRDRERQNQEHMSNIQAAREDRVDPAYVDRMIETDLQDETQVLLSNLMSRDWVLSQMNDAEVHEAKWLSRVMVLELSNMHPPEDSIWSGDYRVFASGDPEQCLEPLTRAQKLAIHEFIQGFIARVARSREGFQQEIFKKQISASERRDNEDDDGGWL